MRIKVLFEGRELGAEFVDEGETCGGEAFCSSLRIDGQQTPYCSIFFHEGNHILAVREAVDMEYFAKHGIVILEQELPA